MKPFLRQQLERYPIRLGELNFFLQQEGITDDMKKYLALNKEHAEVSLVASEFALFLKREKDLAEAQEMLNDNDMREMHEMAKEEVKEAQLDLERLEDELQRLLLPKDPDDERNAFVEIRAGTGGDESALFAGDLMRMYIKYGERIGFKVEIMSESPGEVGGYKEVVLKMSGTTNHGGIPTGAYGMLKFESGGHRVQRVPDTETQGRIHTSACTVAVMAEPDEAVEITLNPSDLRIDTYRASGAGGQHINKTDSAVRVTTCPLALWPSVRKDVANTATRRKPCAYCKRVSTKKTVPSAMPKKQPHAKVWSAAETAATVFAPTTSRKAA